MLSYRVHHVDMREDVLTEDTRTVYQASTTLESVG